jgi:hypothetical protein
MRLPSDRAAAQLAALYRQAETELTGLIHQALASGALATAAYRRRALLAVQTVLARLAQTATPQARDTVRSAYEVGQQLALLPQHGVTGPSFGGHIHTEAIQVIADALTNRLDDAVRHVGRQVDDIFRREQLRAAASMLLTQGTVPDARREMIDRLTDQGVKGFTDRAGRQWGLANYAEMAVRTTARQAVTEGARNSLLERSIDLVRISSHPTSCPQCKPFQGKTYSLTGATPGYPHATVLPPIHPNCRHVMYPAAANAGLPLSEDALQARIAKNRARQGVLA